MALTYTEVLVTVVGDQKMSIYCITGDGSITDIDVTKMKLQYANAAIHINVDDTNSGQLTTYAGSTLVFGTAIASTKKRLIVAFGY